MEEQLGGDVAVSLCAFTGERIEQRNLWVDLPVKSSERVAVWPKDAEASNR